MNPQNVRALYEERMSAVHQLRALAAEAGNRAFTAEERAAEDRLNAAVDNLDARIRNGLTAMERNAKGDEARSAFSAMTGGATARISNPQVGAFLRGETRSLELPIETRDLSVGVTTAGGHTVPTLMGSLMEHLVEGAALMAAKPTVITTAGGEPLAVPKTTSKAAASLVSEGSAIGESDPAFGQVTIPVYKLAYITQVTAELLADSSLDVESFLGRQAGEALGNKLGEYLVNGTGSSQPTGFLPVSTLGVTAAGVAAVTSDELIDLYHSLAVPYRKGAVWVIKDSSVKAIRKLKETTGQYLWQPGLAAGQPDTLLGAPVVVDPNMPAMTTGLKSIAFGDFSKMVVRFAGNVRFERSDDYAFNSDLVTFRAILRAGCDLVDRTGAVRHLIQA